MTNRPRKKYDPMPGAYNYDGTPTDKVEKPKGPTCPQCGKDGKFAFGQMIICATKHLSDNKTCDERGAPPPEDDDTPAYLPHWYGRGWYGP